MYGLMYYVCVEFNKLCAYPPLFPFHRCRSFGYRLWQGLAVHTGVMLWIYCSNGYNYVSADLNSDIGKMLFM